MKHFHRQRAIVLLLIVEKVVLRFYTGLLLLRYKNILVKIDPKKVYLHTYTLPEIDPLNSTNFSVNFHLC